MKVADLINALAIPPGACVEKRVPKKILMEQGAPTQADKRNIQDGIEDMFWIAALKPSNVAVPVYRDEVREYLEIAVLSATLRSKAKASRLVELIHRSIPYPTVLLFAQAKSVTFSLAHKRQSLGEAGQVVVDGDIVTVDISKECELEATFMASLAVAKQPAVNLYALYQSWMNRAEELIAARITGHYALSETLSDAAVRKEVIKDHEKIQRELAALRADAVKEKQINRRVEINLKIKQLEAERNAKMRILKSGEAR